jgi:metallo-beta-lactamase family protein
MKITLLGAAGGEVTGSAYLVQTGDANVMVDCGLFQGAQKLENSNRLPTTGGVQQLHSVVLTHAHLDQASKPWSRADACSCRRSRSADRRS